VLVDRGVEVVPARELVFGQRGQIGGDRRHHDRAARTSGSREQTQRARKLSRGHLAVDDDAHAAALAGLAEQHDRLVLGRL